MIVVMQPNAGPEQIAKVEERLRSFGYTVHRSGSEQIVLGAVGTPRSIPDPRDLQTLEGVREVIRVARPFKLVNRAFRPEGTIVDVGGVRIGGDELVVIAGPCAVESREQLQVAAAAVRAAGARILRGGAFKPRSSPYAFQGMGEEGLVLLREAADEQGLPFVTEVLDTADVALVERYADMLQIGARNMQNFRLLARLGQSSKPVLLKRGISATLEELLMAAEYIVASGNPRVVLCERGIRTFEPWTRNTLDLSAIPVLRKVTHLPVIVDPSHATGIRDHVNPMARAAVAAGADGIIVEVHPTPETALCDGAQSLTIPGFRELMADLRIIAPAVRRHFSAPQPTLRKTQAQPLFARACVVGVGLIGGSLALALRESGVVGRCVGVDRPEALDGIRAAGVVDEVVPVDRLGEALAQANLVVLAAPVREIEASLRLIALHLLPGALVTDVGGTKQLICESAAQALPPSVHFIGGHPMAGSERRGASAADPLLFSDAVYVLCPNPGTPPDVVALLSQAIRAIGAHPLEVEPERHDRLAAAVSHVPHLLAVALANSVGRLGLQDALALRLAASGFRDMTRTASSPYPIWADVLSTNRVPIHERLAFVRQCLDRLEAAMDDEGQLQAEIEEAAAHRLNVPRAIPGIQRSEAELIVRVMDKPGAIAEIATALAREQINIRDIQVLKIRQDENGTLRLAFENREITCQAAEVLRRIGQSVRLRSD